MRKGIHPDYKEVKVECNCGNSFITKAVKKDGLMKIELCDKCHPFFTGKRRIVDSSGRVDKFNKRYGR